MLGLMPFPSSHSQKFQSMQTGDPAAPAFAGEFLRSILPLPAGGFSSGLTAINNETFFLDGSQALILVGAEASPARCRGKRCTRLTCAGTEAADALALVPGLDFHDGLIQVSLACRALSPALEASCRAGIAFRVSAEKTFECVSLQPGNSRCLNQERRNRTLQYQSLPHFPAEVLNTGSPCRWSAHADCPPNVWLSLRLEVCAGDARLYLNGSDQPTLVIDDLKLAPGVGTGVGLWIAKGAEVFVSDIHVVHWKR